MNLLHGKSRDVKHFTVIVSCFGAKPPNGSRYPLGVGRDNATLTEPASSHANCLKTRRLPPVGCTLCWAALDLLPPIHPVLPSNSCFVFSLDMFNDFLPKNKSIEADNIFEGSIVLLREHILVGKLIFFDKDPIHFDIK